MITQRINRIDVFGINMANAIYAFDQQQTTNPTEIARTSHYTN